MMADRTQTKRRSSTLRRLWRGLAPALPGAVGAAALTGLFAAVMPLPWVEYICWNLYLDALGPWFLAPVGNAGRLALALLIALVVGLVALLIGLMLVKPAAKGNQAMNNRVAQRARQAADAPVSPADDAAGPIRHRAADAHPDAPPRAPINAARDLPAGGLGPIDGADLSGSPMTLAPDAPSGDALSGDAAPLELTDFAPADPEYADDAAAPDAALDLAGFASPQDTAAPVSAPELAPNPVDNLPHTPDTLEGLVARLEAGLERRRTQAAQAATGPDLPGLPAANEDDEPVVDLALEAALSTLQRMSARVSG